MELLIVSITWYSSGGHDRSRIIDSQCEWGIRIVLFAKNDILYRFLNDQMSATATPCILLAWRPKFFEFQYPPTAFG